MTTHIAEVAVDAAHPALPGHFPGRPIVPAAWILTLVDAACREAWPDIVVEGLVHARFRSPLLPGVTMRIELERRGDASVAFACVGTAVRIADGVLAVAPAARP